MFADDAFTVLLRNGEVRVTEYLVTSEEATKNNETIIFANNGRISGYTDFMILVAQIATAGYEAGKKV